MEVKGKRQQTGDYIIEAGSTIISLPQNVIAALANLMNNRKDDTDGRYKARVEQRLQTFRAFANQVSQFDGPVIQGLLSQITMEQMVTLARLADGDKVYQKIVANLSRQNARQFEDDYQRLNKITVHQASAQMDKIVPIIQRAIKSQKYNS